MYTPSDFDFLLQPIFLRGFSGLLHLVLLLSLFLSWVCRKSGWVLAMKVRNRVLGNLDFRIIIQFCFVVWVFQSSISSFVF
ncbi:hypothetical protein CsSME_00026067 [Camellia sinensis var. sinensis]